MALSNTLYCGLSGLDVNQVKLNVVGNNIANVNTTGFKRGRTEFQDMLSQTLSGAAKPTTEVGGVNPIQVGLGMMVKSIDTIHTQGALQSTGVMTDVALQGNGFFITQDGDKRFYTRNGAFGLDQDGRLVGKGEQGEVGLKEYLSKFVSENPELLPARMAWDAPPPVTPNADGSYPVAVPGVTQAF